MPEFTREDRRRNRKVVLEALKAETGSSGGDAAGPRVRAYCDDPENAPAREFAYVGALVLQRFYLAPDQPGSTQKAGLWKRIRNGLGLPLGAVPGGWDGGTDVATLQQLAEETE